MRELSPELREDARGGGCMSDPSKPDQPGSPFPSGPGSPFPTSNPPPAGSPFPSGPPPQGGSPFPSGQDNYGQNPYGQNPYAGNVPNVREAAGWKWSPLIGITYNGFPVGLIAGVLILILVYAGH
jgi:hypothetical protein